jgi:hypothetical protein
MKRMLFLFSCMLFMQESFSQTTYYPGNGLSISNDSFHLGGNMLKNTSFKGINNSTRYNFSLDTFGLINFNAKRIDWEGYDSVRFISNKLIKGMSEGDIHFGASNSIVLDGNLWFKRYKKTSSNFGLLTIDTCGRLELSSDLEANKLTVYDDIKFSKYKKTSDNTGILTVDTAGKLGISTSINLNNYLKLGGNDLGGADMSFGTTSPGVIHLAVNNNETMQFWEGYNVQYGSTQMRAYGSTNPSIALYNTAGQYKVGLNMDGLFMGNHYFSNEGIVCNSGNGFKLNDNAWTFASLEKFFYNDNTNKTFNTFKIAPTIIYSSGDAGIYRGLYINPSLGGTHENLKERFRSIEVAYGNVLLNSEGGATGIGVSNLIDNSAILELKSTDKGFLLPRMNTYNRDNIATPATGLMLYNTDSNWVEIKKPEGWYKLLNAPVASGGGDLSRSSNPEPATPKSSFVSRIGDGQTKTFNIKHNLNSEFVMVQFIDCGAEANCNLLLSIPEGARLEINGKDEVQLTFKNAPSFNRYKVMFLKIQ